MNRQRVARTKQVSRHVGPHPTQTDKCKSHDQSISLDHDSKSQRTMQPLFTDHVKAGCIRSTRFLNESRTNLLQVDNQRLLERSRVSKFHHEAYYAVLYRTHDLLYDATDPGSLAGYGGIKGSRTYRR